MEMIPMLDLRAQFESVAPEIRAAVEAVLTSQQFVLGPQGGALEREIAVASGVSYGVGLASGTEALELGLHACGVKAGDEVIVPAFTFIATGSAVSALGARPVFGDIEPATFNLDPDQIEARITPRTRAIVVVHLFGLAADMDPILAIADKHGIPVVEDNAQSFGATYHRRKTGSMGHLGCLSFYPSKNLGAYGDAGMIVTSEIAPSGGLDSLSASARPDVRLFAEGFARDYPAARAARTRACLLPLYNPRCGARRWLHQNERPGQ
jgi:dTDP-4-amino-4,6-dideoxygalactose transaminase